MSAVTGRRHDAAAHDHAVEHRGVEERKAADDDDGIMRFFKFIMDEIFPGGRLPTVARSRSTPRRRVSRSRRIQPLQPHYARTLDIWAAALEARRDEAIAIQSQEVYDRYMRYLTGCAELFRDGYTDMCQFTLEKRTGNQEPLITGTGPSQV